LRHSVVCVEAAVSVVWLVEFNCHCRCLYRLSKDGRRILYRILEYDPLLDSSNMTYDDYVHLATDIYVCRERYTVLSMPLCSASFSFP